MNNKEIYDTWTDFLEKYEKYFISIENKWYIMLEKSKKHIDDNDEKPSPTSKNREVQKMGNWFCNQQAHYKKKIGIMKNKKIYDKWTEFMEDYSE